MARLKRRLLIIGGLTAGILAVRAFRKRRSQPTESNAVEVEHHNPHSAAEHASAAADHANVAAKKALTTTETGES